MECSIRNGYLGMLVVEKSADIYKSEGATQLIIAGLDQGLTRQSDTT